MRTKPIPTSSASKKPLKTNTTSAKTSSVKAAPLKPSTNAEAIATTSKQNEETQGPCNACSTSESNFYYYEESECKKTPATIKPQIQPITVSERRLYSIKIQELPAMLAGVYQNGNFTPLILDESGRADVFFSYSGENALMMHVKPLLVKVDIQKTMTRLEAKEEMRLKVMNSMKYGHSLVFALENSAFDFKKYYDPLYFPSVIFDDSGVTLTKLTSLHQEFVRPEEFKDFYAHPEFRVVVTSRFSVEDYQEFLGNSLDLKKFIPILVLPE